MGLSRATTQRSFYKHKMALESDKSRNLIDSLRAILGNSVPFPQIAVVGDTSAGKSSVLSALSGFEFPSSDGLCTRCPIQMRLSRAKQFSCTISLQHPMDAKPEKHVNLQPEQLESVGKSAEVIERWMGFAVESAGDGAEFSDTMVVINAEDPSYPDLTLIDLPGIVRTTKDVARQAIVITQVKEMLLRYIQQSRTVILAVMAANVAIDNQEVLKMAKDTDQDGVRTLAILTKPDTIERGSEQTIRQIMLNEEYPIQLGWASIKCRDKLDRDQGMTIAQGIQAETAFFRDKLPWCDIISDSRVVLGVSMLQMRLSNLLHERITQELPNVCREIETKRDQTRDQLNAMPKMLRTHGERRLAFEKCFRLFIELLRKSSNDVSSDDFFRVFPGKVKTGVAPASNRWCAVNLLMASPFRQDIYAICSKFDDSNLNFDQLKENDLVTYVRNGEYELVKWNLKYTESKLFLAPFVAEINTCISHSRGQELEGFLSFPVFCNLWIQHFVSFWKDPAKQYVKAMFDLSLDIAMRAVHLANDRSTCSAKVESFLVEVVKSVWRSQEIKLNIDLNELITLEQSPSTLNHYFYETVQKMRVQPLIDQLERIGDDNGMVHRDAVLEVVRKTSNQSNSTHETNDMLVMLRSYSKVSMKRFVDNVLQRVTHHFKAFIDELETIVPSQTSDDRLQSMLSPSQQSVLQREICETRLQKLDEALETIRMYRCGWK